MKSERDRSKDRSLVGCYICRKGYPLEDMHHRGSRGYICKDCHQKMYEGWSDKPDNKEPK